MKIELDIVVFGGGVAGLWTLHKLREAGYRTLLLETNRLGYSQTRSAQGIVHGGLKYQLGKSSHLPDAADLPTLWQRHLRGDLHPDLHSVPMLSDAQYMWARGLFGGRIITKLARKAVAGSAELVTGEERPELFLQSGFKGKVLRVQEPVIDTVALLKALATPHQDAILKTDYPDNVDIFAGKRPRVELNGPLGSHTIVAKKLVFAAGAGNEALLKYTRRQSHTNLREQLRVPMQSRPLHMLMARGDLPKNVFAHCIGVSDVPKLTITTHRDKDQRTVWYIGGDIAEQGISDTPDRHIRHSFTKVSKLMPWVDFSDVQWSSFHVERAEPYQATGGRPKSFFAEDAAGIITAWPTKMIFAPLLAERIIDLLKSDDIRPSSGPEGRAALDINDATLQMPALAERPWDSPRPWR